jgi:hypothetical protein
MPIRKDVSIPIDNELISGAVVFDTLSDFRLVDPIYTTIVVLLINKWMDSNLNYEYEFNVNHLIPENIIEGDRNEKYSNYYVDNSYELLKPNLNLNFNEALFILLGLDTYRLALPPFHNIKLEEYQPTSDGLSLGSRFFITKQYKELRRSEYLNNEKISSKNLIRLAKKFKFFQESGLRHILKVKKSTSGTDKSQRDKKIRALWKELSPQIGSTYQDKVSIYREIILIENLEIKEDTVGRIINK